MAKLCHFGKNSGQAETVLANRVKGEEKMEIARFLKSILRMLWLIIILGLVGGGVSAYTGFYMTKPVYEAETTVYALSKSSSVDGQESINYQDVMLSRQLLLDYREIITSEKVLDLASDNLKSYGITQDQLKGMISVYLKNESSVMGIVAKAGEPQTAAAASNEVTRAFVTRLQELTNNSIVGILDEAKVPQFPADNDYTKRIIIGIAAGAVIAVAIIYIKELFNTKIRYIEDIEKNTGIRVIGVIPKYGIN